MSRGQWKNTSHPGVRFRLHPTRKHGVQRDRYFAVRYYVDGQRVEEGVGWASEGWTAEKASLLRAELRKAVKTGEGARTLGEKREQAKAEREEEQARNMSLADYWRDHYAPSASRAKKAESFEKEESHFRLWLNPILGKVRMQDVGMGHWDDLVSALAKAGRSKRTQEYVTGTLRRVLKHAYHRRFIDEAPPSGKRVGVTGPGASNRRLRVIRPEEAEVILAELEQRDRNAWRVTRFTFLTGCRASEAFNLKWAQVDLGGGRLRFVETKNRDTRTLPITSALREIFDEISMGEPDERVFVKETGEPYKQAPYSFKAVVSSLGLNEGRSDRDKITWHSIRHSVATSLASRLNPRDLMEVMGWRTVQMAMRYVHGDDSAKLHALSGLERGLVQEKAKVLPFARPASGDSGE
ncbi:MAG: hypothetical protein PWQ57_2822 [Desulfovibrionales bacterium]|nr:hypothetical protein [Desulfovibrionales bacterium]